MYFISPSLFLSLYFSIDYCVSLPFIRIDTNTQETQMNVEAAHGEILKYFQGVTSNRWLMIKIFGVVLVFFIIFIVFLT